jgi:hypothetical protein
MEHVDDAASIGTVVTTYINVIGVLSGENDHFEDMKILRWHNSIQMFTRFVWCRIDTNGELL